MDKTGAVGLSFLQFCNLDSFRTKFIVGFSVFMGLSVPQYFNEYTVIAGYGPVHTHARWVCEEVNHLWPPIAISFWFVIPAFYWHWLFFSLLFLSQFNDIINVAFSSKPFVAGFVAFFLDNTLLRQDNATRKDRGNHWWERFRSFKTDPRTEEFYVLPFNLNKFCPPDWSR